MAVCHTNDGYSYLSIVVGRLGITCRGILKKYVMLKDRTVKKEKMRKSSRTAKRARLIRRINSLMHGESKCRKEGVTYESGMGLKDASNMQQWQRKRKRH